MLKKDDEGGGGGGGGPKSEKCDDVICERPWKEIRRMGPKCITWHVLVVLNQWMARGGTCIFVSCDVSPLTFFCETHKLFFLVLQRKPHSKLTKCQQQPRLLSSLRCSPHRASFS